MRQLAFGFASQRDAASVVPLDPEIQERLVALIAEAILTVVDAVQEARGGQNDDAQAIERQDQTASPEQEGRGLHAPVHDKAGP